MIVCDNCGKENKNSSKFCTGCGNIILTSMQPANHDENNPSREMEMGKWVCIKCGNQNKPNTEFCVKCGNNTSSFSIQPVPHQLNIPIQEIIHNEFLCKQCGKQNKESAKFCIFCGNNLRLSIQDTEEHQESTAIKEEPPANTENEVNREELPAELNVLNMDIISVEANKQEVVQKTGNGKLILENPEPVSVDHKINLNKCKEYAIEQILPLKDDIQSKVNVFVEKSKEAEDNEENVIPDVETVAEENYLAYPEPERKRKKAIIWTICILILTGAGAFFLFGGNKADENKGIVTNDASETTAKKETDSVNKRINNTSKIKELTKTNATVITPDELTILKPDKDNFKYLSLNQIKNDLVNKELCNGLMFTGEEQQLTISGYFPDMQTQKKSARILL